MKPAPGQLDLLELAADIEWEQTPIVCLYRSSARGLDARAAELEDTPRKRHAWSLHSWNPMRRTVRCNATNLSADTRTWRDGETWPCGCGEINELMYRGACLGIGCTWEGEPRTRENAAVEDAMDHAWPGWRDLPAIDALPELGAKDVVVEKWLAKVGPLYPPGWIEQGGPVRTWRDAVASRHHGPSTPFGGYNLGVIRPQPEKQED